MLNSPNSPDHDAVEDRQLSMVSANKALPLGINTNMPPRPPLLASNNSKEGPGSPTGMSDGQNQQHRMHVHNHGTGSPSKMVSSLDNEGDEGKEEKSGASLSMSDEMAAVSMAARGFVRKCRQRRGGKRKLVRRQRQFQFWQ